MSEFEGVEEGLVRAAKDLNVYQLAYSTSMEIFEISKRFPAEEEVRTHQPNSSLVQIGLPELARSLGQKTLRSPFHS